MKRIVVSLLSLLVLCSCSVQRAYDGPSKSIAEVARVYGHGVSLESVNGKRMGALSSSVEVLPGENTVEISIDAANYGTLQDGNRRRYQIVFNAEAGRDYSITARRGDRRLCAWPVDSETGRADFQKPAACATLLVR